MEGDREGKAPKPDDTSPDRWGTRATGGDTGERDWKADEREEEADRREAVADERERVADEREARLAEREQQASERERRLDERARQLGADAEGRQKRRYEDIERARAVLAYSMERLNHSEAALKRTDARVARDQPDIDRSVEQTERDLVRQPPDPSEQIKRAAALRKQLVIRWSSVLDRMEPTVSPLGLALHPAAGYAMMPKDV